jgi:asparagine synthase (glutamine-hydrolysing)
MAASFDRLPGAGLFREAIRRGLPLLPRGGRRTSLFSRGRRFLDGLAEAPERRYAHWFCHFTGDRKEELCTPEFRRAAASADDLEVLLAAYRENSAADFADATMGVDAALYLPDDLLVKVDIASMAHSLEARSPFLDHEFMEFAATIPSDLKVRGRTKKYILKQALRGLLPDGILHRAKMGFGVPIDHWLRHELRELARETLLGSVCMGRGYFRREPVERMLSEHVQGTANWHYLLWNLLMLELWHQTYVDGDGALAAQRRSHQPTPTLMTR